MAQIVSIVVPIYNAEHHLNRCISSLIDQTYEEIEIILINDGSLDGSLDICKKFEEKDPRVIVLSQPNGGVSSARNLGIEAASGDYIAFADADDTMQPHAIQSMLFELESSQVDVVRMKCEREVDGLIFPEKTIGSGVYRDEAIVSVIEAIVTGKMSAYMWLLLIRADKIPAEVRLSTELQLMEDTCFYVDLLQRIRSIKVSDTITYTYVANERSATRNPKKFIRNAENILAVNRRFNFLLAGENYLQDMNASHVRLISNIVFILGSQHKESIDFKNLIVQLLAQGYKEVFENSNLRSISLHNAILARAIYRGPSVARACVIGFSILKGISERIRDRANGVHGRRSGRVPQR